MGFPTKKDRLIGEIMIRKKTSIMLILPTLLLVFLLVFPILWMYMTSFKTPAEIQKIPVTILPSDIKNFANYVEVLTTHPFIRYIANSLIVSSFSCLVSILVTSMAGYGFSKYKFPGKEFFFFLILCFLTVPFQAVVVPLFQWINMFNLNDTYLGIALPLLVSSFGVFLMRQGADMVPSEIIEAARIDGSSELNTFFQIVFPLIKPFVATQAIIKFMWSWNEFFWPLVITNGEKMKVVTVGLQSYKNDYFIQYNLLTAASLLSIIPMIVMFSIFQKGIIQSAAMSGLKG